MKYYRRLPSGYLQLTVLGKSKNCSLRNCSARLKQIARDGKTFQTNVLFLIYFSRILAKEILIREIQNIQTTGLLEAAQPVMARDGNRDSLPVLSSRNLMKSQWTGSREIWSFETSWQNVSNRLINIFTCIEKNG